MAKNMIRYTVNKETTYDSLFGEPSPHLQYIRSLGRRVLYQINKKRLKPFEQKLSKGILLGNQYGGNNKYLHSQVLTL